MRGVKVNMYRKKFKFSLLSKVRKSGRETGDGNWLRELLDKCKNTIDLRGLRYEELDSILEAGATASQRAAVDKLFVRENDLRKGALDAKVDLRVADNLADQVGASHYITLYVSDTITK